MTVVLLTTYREKYSRFTTKKIQLCPVSALKSFLREDRSRSTEGGTTSLVLAKVIKKINIPLFKVMFEAALEQFFKRDVLVRNNISYKDALDEIVDILINGIVV